MYFSAEERLDRFWKNRWKTSRISSHSASLAICIFSFNYISRRKFHLSRRISFWSEAEERNFIYLYLCAFLALVVPPPRFSEFLLSTVAKKPSTATFINVTSSDKWYYFDHFYLSFNWHRISCRVAIMRNRNRQTHIMPLLLNSCFFVFSRLYTRIM